MAEDQAPLQSAQNGPPTTPDVTGTDAANTATGTDSINVAGNIPNPIKDNTPAALGVTAPPVPTKPTAPAPASQSAPQPNQPQTPQDLHQSIFKNVLGMLTKGSGRPQMGPNGQPATDANGNVIMQRGNVKTLGASILAGALSGMVAGFGAPDKRTELGGGRSIADYSGAAAAGATAGSQFGGQARKAAAQGQVDAAQARQFATTEHNLKMHAAILGNLKLQGDVLNEGVQQDAPLIEAMKLNPTITDEKGNVLSAIKGEHVSETALQKMMADASAHVTRDSVLRDGVQNVYDESGKQVFNPDGTPRQEYTYAVYDHNAQVALTDELKKGSPALQYVAPGTSVPMAVLGKYNREKMDVQNAQGFMNQWAQQVADFNGDEKTKPIDIKAAIAKDPYLRKIVPSLGRYAGMDPAEAIQQMNKDGVDPALVGKFNLLLGGVNTNDWNRVKADKILEDRTEIAEKKARELADAKRTTPEGQQDLEHKKLENQQLQQAIAQTQAAQTGIIVPKNFVADPHAVSQDSATLSKTLAGQGVQIPSDFQTLYGVAHNAVSDDVYTNNPRPKSGLMPRPQAVAFIRTFINPNWNEGDFKANANLQKEIRSTRQGTAGGSLLAAGTASNHLALLEDQADKLVNGNLTDLNSVANAIGVHTGSSAPVVFKAIAQQVNSEVAKVVAGGQPHEAELKQFEESLNNAQSPQQIKDVIHAYIGLMNGRIGEIDDRNHQYLGQHIGVSPELTSVFNKHGFTVPGQPKGAVGQAKFSDGQTYWVGPDKKPLGKVQPNVAGTEGD